jgi:hypothetical protein
MPNRLKIIFLLFVLLAMASSLLYTNWPVAANDPVPVPVFDYPANGQTLDYEGQYLFQMHPIDEAAGFLWSFEQDGHLVWENLRDEGRLHGNGYGIAPNSFAHSQFAPGQVKVSVRAQVNGHWSDARTITIILKPKHEPTPEPPTTEPEPPTSTPEIPTTEPEPPTSTPEIPTTEPEPPTSTPETPTAEPEPPTSTPEIPTTEPEPPTSTPETPTTEPEPPTSTPEIPTTEPEPPTSTPETPTAEPEPPTSTPEIPTTEPEPPTSTPETPTTEPEPPTSTPETPTTEPEPPTSTPETPTTEPESPTSTPEIPTTEPEPPTSTPETPTAEPEPTPTTEPILSTTQVQFDSGLIEKGHQVAASFFLDTQGQSILGVKYVCDLDNSRLSILDMATLDDFGELISLRMSANESGQVEWSLSPDDGQSFSGNGALFRVIFESIGVGQAGIFCEAHHLTFMDEWQVIHFQGATLDILEHVVPPPGDAVTVSGQIILLNRAYNTARIAIQDESGQEIVWLVPDTSGNFQVTLPAGAYTFLASAPGFLSAQRSENVTGDIILPPVTLLAGDINLDGKINSLDLTIASNLYNKSPLTVPAADLNGDGMVNLLDMVMLAANYLKTGPVDW